MSKNEVSLRLSVKGREELLKTMKDMGGEYEKAAGKIEAGSRKSNAALKGVNAASQEAQRGMEGLSGRAGGLGKILGALGPAGMAASAGIGAMAVALSGALKISREAVSAFDKIGKGADTLQMSTDAFQALKNAAGEEGVEFTKVEAAVRNLDKAHADLVRGKGDLLARLKDTNPRLVEMLRNTTDNEQRLRIMTDALRGAKDETERASIAYAAFGTTGLDVALMLERQQGGMKGMIDRAKELGLVVREDVIRNAEDMETKFGHASQVIDLQLKQAFIDLAPILLKSAQLMADIATGISDVMARTREFNDRTTPQLESRMEELIKKLQAAGASRDAIMKSLATGDALGLTGSAGSAMSPGAGARSDAALLAAESTMSDLRKIYGEMGKRAEQAFQKAATETRQQAEQSELQARRAALEASLDLTKKYAAEAARDRDGDAVNQFMVSASEIKAEMDRIDAELERRKRLPKALTAADPAAEARALAELNRLRA
ncbi:MAG: hypothetical protein Q8L84_08465, partial [Hyphomonas sp.]|nr:hypothetical protein [Hyphomonas sp.]